MAQALDLSVVEEFTLGDMLDFEQYSGMAFEELGAIASGNGQQMPLRVMLTFLWLARRKDDPSLTFEKARDLKITDLAALVGDPTPAASLAKMERPAGTRKRAS